MLPQADAPHPRSQLQLVFTRLLGAGDWSHVQLVRYLVSVKSTLTAAEKDRLRKTNWLPREGEAKVEQPVGADGTKPRPKTVRYRAAELYEPTEQLRELGLPLVDWSDSQSKWRSGSDEGASEGPLIVSIVHRIDLLHKQPNSSSTWACYAYRLSRRSCRLPPTRPTV